MKFIAAFVSGWLLASAAHAEPPADYHLVWSDEFNRNGAPDSSKWHYDTKNNKTGWWHNEAQYYAAHRLQNARVQDGLLILEARKEDLRNRSDWGGQHYSSALLMTRDTQQWTYGFFEVRAKVPCVIGLWPAFWLLGPPSALQRPEIDIMEEYGFSDISGTVHSAASERDHLVNAGHAHVDEMCMAFHDYQTEWTPDGITFLVDGAPYYHYDKPADSTDETWPFDTPEYLILSLAVDVGGKHDIDDSAFPARMEVDYVRVYQK